MDYNEALDIHRRLRDLYKQAQQMRVRERLALQAITSLDVLNKTPYRQLRDMYTYQAPRIDYSKMGSSSPAGLNNDQHTRSLQDGGETGIQRALDLGATYMLGHNIFMGIGEAARKVTFGTTYLTPDMFPTKRGVVIMDGQLNIEFDDSKSYVDPYPLHPVGIGGLLWDCDYMITNPENRNDVAPGVLMATLTTITDPKVARVTPLDVEWFATWRYTDSLARFHERSKRWNTTPEDPECLVTMSTATYLVALLRFMQQRIVTSQRLTVSRANRRNIERSKWKHDSTVNVIKLRKSHAVWKPRFPGDVQPRDWSCSWGVRGHWRDQPCGPGRKQVKSIWIDPYIKGDTTKPLRVKTDIFAVTR